MDANVSKEMNTLIHRLFEAGIPFEVGGQPICGRAYVQIACPSFEDCAIDAICHEFSYGGNSGLIEIMSAYDEDGDVVGWLAAEDALPYFQTAWNQKYKELVKNARESEAENG